MKDKKNDVVINFINDESNKFQESVLKYSSLLPDRIKKYLVDRGIYPDIIDKYKIGYGKFYKRYWITIPIKNNNGKYIYFKLREDPDYGNKKLTYPKGNEAQIFNNGILCEKLEYLFICEGEIDCMLLTSYGINAISSTQGALTFKKDWIDKLKNIPKIYVCYDKDDASQKGAKKVLDLINDSLECKTFIVNLPKEVGDGGDITNYFIDFKGKKEDLFDKYSREYPEKFDITKFKSLSINDLISILDLTIKNDDINKVATFLCGISTYTQSSQFNISFNAPSSTGKSYIPNEISKLFPEEDIIAVAYCSPTAFFHDVGEETSKGYMVDISRKLLIFLDQPHTLLLQHLRPLLSHDKKELNIKITDKTMSNGLATKNIVLKGFPSVIFCTAGLKIDEQESTRFLLLSPEMSQEKIKEGINIAIRKESNKESFNLELHEDKERTLLMDRIRAIKVEKIDEIIITQTDMASIKNKFLMNKNILKPRHQRDIKRVISLIKSFSLLNLWHRERDGKSIIANSEDIENAFKIWDVVSISQELNILPYVFDLYNEVILAVYKEKNKDNSCNIGVTRQEISSKYYEVKDKLLDSLTLRQQILPMLESVGLIVQEEDPTDKRKVLIFPKYFK